MSSITHEITSSTRTSIRTQSKKYKHGNESSIYTGNSGSTCDPSTESTADGHPTANGCRGGEENCNGSLNMVNPPNGSSVDKMDSDHKRDFSRHSNLKNPINLAWQSYVEDNS